MILFTIQAEIQKILDSMTMDEETGELFVSDEQIQALQDLELEKEEKIKNTALYVFNLKSDINAISEQIKVFTERKKRLEKQSERIQKFIADILQGEKREYPECIIKFTKSNSVALESEFIKWAIDNKRELLRFKEPEPDKTEIKKALSAGETIPYASIVQNTNISIK